MSGFNPGGPPPPKKETVYDGPDHYAVSSSSNPTPQAAAAGVKKETVYGQSQPPVAGFGTPPPGFGTPPPPPLKQETVFGGFPATQNVYNQQTISPTKASNSVAKQATETKLRKASTWFFVTAGILTLEAIIFWGGTFHGASALLGPSAALLAVIYFALGFSARQLNPQVFLVAVVAYALQTLLYLYLMFTTDLGMIVFLRPLVVKCFVLYRLWGYYHEVRLYHAPEE
jgi:hypothetical protein